MRTIDLTEKELNHCIYSSGYISVMISKLMEIYEAGEYLLADLHGIGKSSLAIISRPYEQKIRKSNVEVRELSKSDLIKMDLDYRKVTYKRTTCLPPSQLKERFSDITTGLDEETLKKYPYIQEFIDYLYQKQIEVDDELTFFQNLKLYLKDFIKTHQSEMNHYTSENFGREDNLCLVNRAVFFNSLKYIINKFEKPCECRDEGRCILDDEDDSESYDMMYNLVVFTPKSNFAFQTYVGRFKRDGIKPKDHFENGNLELQHFILNMLYDKASIFQQLPVVRYYLGRLYELSKEKCYVDASDIELIIAEINNEYKKARGRK